jgi:hypothetical protein
LETQGKYEKFKALATQACSTQRATITPYFDPTSWQFVNVLVKNAEGIIDSALWTLEEGRPPDWSTTVNTDISGKLVPIQVEKSTEKFDCRKLPFRSWKKRDYENVAIYSRGLGHKRAFCFLF